jgi:hypothetical protein
MWEALAPKQKLESPSKKKTKKNVVPKSKTKDAEKIEQDEIESEDENLELTASGIKASSKKGGGKKKSNRSKKRSKRRKR